MKLLPYLANAAVVVALAAAAAVSGMTHDAPRGHFDGAMGTLPPGYGKPANLPTWESHGGAAGCERVVEGVLVDEVLVVTQDGETVRMSFDEAMQRAESAAWVDDVWTVGVCR